MGLRFPYPDGTMGTARPKDGETWTDPKTNETWMFDDFCGQWFKKVHTGSGYPHIPMSPSTSWTPLDLDNVDISDWNVQVYSDAGFKLTNPECECGAEKCGSNRHSSWCAKYDIST